LVDIIKNLVDRVNKVASMIDNVKDYMTLSLAQELNGLLSYIKQLEEENADLKKKLAETNKGSEQ